MAVRIIRAQGKVELPALPEFDGDAYVPELDKPRLITQLQKVYTILSDGRWRTLFELEEAMGYTCSQTSASAFIRDLRKQKWGGFTVERRRRGPPKQGVFEYRLVPGSGEVVW